MLQPGYSAVPLAGYATDPASQLNQLYYNELSFAGQIEPVGPIATNTGAASLPYATPAANFAETPDSYCVIVELPGVELKDVTLQLQGQQLILTAFRKPIFTQGPSTYGYLAAEGRFGSLRRSFVLPAGANRSAIQAQFGHGLLTIYLPKVAPQQGTMQTPAVSEVAINAAL